MKKLLVFILSCSMCISSFAKHDLDSIVTHLDNVIANSVNYQTKKEQHIQRLKIQRAIDDLSATQTYKINNDLFAEYEKYNTDSAVIYILHNQAIAAQLNNLSLQDEVSIKLAGLYSTKGLYVESKELLANIDKKRLSKELLAEYYYTLTEYYSHYAQSNGDKKFYQMSNVYRDSLLTVLDSKSFRYQVEYAKTILYRDRTGEAEKLLLTLLDQTTDTDLDRALIAYLLGTKYTLNNNRELQQKYFSISAITDRVNCNKDNASLQSLALYYNEQGDVDRAYQFIQLAIEDAVSCNVRYRTMEGSGIYPIINSAYQLKERKQKDQLQSNLILISIMTVFLVLGIVRIYQQMKRLSSIRKRLHTANEQLNQLNVDLSTMNTSLLEANHVKEEYIAYFFDVCSNYIDKIENYHKTFNRKDNQQDKFRSTTILENEVEELYKNFDTVFLNIYPNFITDFNGLLLPEEQILPKHEGQLTPELRIFALIRLGITDSVKIAKFLRYSLRTVYNYRTKVRNKAAGDRGNFEKKVLFCAAYK